MKLTAFKVTAVLNITSFLTTPAGKLFMPAVCLELCCFSDNMRVWVPSTSPSLCRPNFETQEPGPSVSPWMLILELLHPNGLNVDVGTNPWSDSVNANTSMIISGKGSTCCSYCYKFRKSWILCLISSTGVDSNYHRSPQIKMTKPIISTALKSSIQYIANTSCALWACLSPSLLLDLVSSLSDHFDFRTVKLKESAHLFHQGLNFRVFWTPNHSNM